jgi:hypothetical protein
LNNKQWDKTIIERIPFDKFNALWNNVMREIKAEERTLNNDFYCIGDLGILTSN